MEIKPTVDYNFDFSHGNKIANFTRPPLLLSILIASIPDRIAMLAKLISDLQCQAVLVGDSYFEILYDDDLSINIGTKRNSLLSRAKGEYIVYIDDDDEINENYLRLIIKAIESKPDCIGISGIITTNGTDKRQWHISKEYGKWFTGPDGTYYRTPNHISPVKRELALQAGFPEIAFGEDAEYSRRLLPLLKTEVKIEQNIYHYKYVSHK